MEIQNDDFNELVKLLQEKNVINKRIKTEFKLQLKNVHRHIYSLSLWSSSLKPVSQSSGLFLREIRSDAIRSLPLCLLGYNKAATHAVRNIIENGLRLIYYSDHPKQYLKVKKTKKGNTSFQELFNYAKSHKKIKSDLKSLKIISKLGTTYSDTSRYVHAIVYPYMDLSHAISSIKFDKNFFQFYRIRLERTSRNINALIALFYYQKFRTMDRSYRNVILKSLGSQYKKYIMNEVEPN